MELTAEYVRSILGYDPETGVFTWRERTAVPHWWNGKYAGTQAGSVSTGGYLQITIDGRAYAAHRLAWLHKHGVWVGRDIDHKNGVRSDNSLENLRPASRRENSVNRTRLNRNNSSGVTGVTLSAPTGRWQARITVGGSRRSLGYFATLEEAAAARRAAEVKHLGGFAPQQRAA